MSNSVLGTEVKESDKMRSLAFSAGQTTNSTIALLSFMIPVCHRATEKGNLNEIDWGEIS